MTPQPIPITSGHVPECCRATVRDYAKRVVGGWITA